MTRTRVDVQIDAAVGLLTNYAAMFPAALHHIDLELRAIDGYPAVTMSDGLPRSESPLNAVERGAEARLRLSAIRTQLVADRDSILTLISSAMHGCRDAIGYREPAATVARCRDHQTGRDGVIEWGRATCEELPAKAGLCANCYQRERYWRTAHALPTRDTAPPVSYQHP